MPEVTNATHLSRQDVEGVMNHVLNILGPHFTQAEQARLAMVGELSDLIGYGDWIVAGIGCPLIQAGIPRSCSDADLFGRHWDACIYDLLRTSGQAKEIAETPQVLSIEG